MPYYEIMRKTDVEREGATTSICPLRHYASLTIRRNRDELRWEIEFNSAQGLSDLARTEQCRVTILPAQAGDEFDTLVLDDDPKD